jgi:hypothetical protein
MEYVRRECRRDELIGAWRAKRLRKRLSSLGEGSFPRVARLAIDDPQPQCRAVGAAALADLALKDRRLVSRFVRELRALANDDELREFYASAIREFGDAANDELIWMLTSEMYWERDVAIECLEDINGERIRGRPELLSYDPKGGREEMERVAGLWRRWWDESKEGRRETP